jgi:hypothetical protein
MQAGCQTRPHDLGPKPRSCRNKLGHRNKNNEAKSKEEVTFTNSVKSMGNAQESALSELLLDSLLNLSVGLYIHVRGRFIL